MTVKEIFSAWLKEKGYDGLGGDECGCCLEDIFLCDACPAYCEPAYKHDIPCHDCDGDCPARDEDCGYEYYMCDHKPPDKTHAQIMADADATMEKYAHLLEDSGHA